MSDGTCFLPQGAPDRRALRRSGIEAVRAGLLLTATAVLGGLYPGSAHAEEVLPMGGAVMAGGASIAASGGQMVVGQTSSRAVIAWDSFSVAPGHAVRFEVPDARSATLNRVTGDAT